MNNSLSFLRGTLGVCNEKFLPFKDAITLASSINSFQNSKKTNLFEAYYWHVVFTEDLEKDSNSTTKRLYNEWIGYKKGDRGISQIKHNEVVQFWFTLLLLVQLDF